MENYRLGQSIANLLMLKQKYIASLLMKRVIYIRFSSIYIGG